MPLDFEDLVPSQSGAAPTDASAAPKQLSLSFDDLIPAPTEPSQVPAPDQSSLSLAGEAGATANTNLPNSFVSPLNPDYDVGSIVPLAQNRQTGEVAWTTPFPGAVRGLAEGPYATSWQNGHLTISPEQLEAAT